MKVLCTIGLQGAFAALTREVEKRTGSKIEVEFGVATWFKSKIEQGFPFDVAILTRAIMDELGVQGGIRKNSIVAVARSGLGLAVPSAARKPDIGSVEALKRTLLSAGTIASSANGLAGLYFSEVIQALGVAEQVGPKLKLETTGGYAAEIAARGDAEMAVQLISEILPVSGVQLVGPFPEQVQKYAILSAGISTSSKEPKAAEELVKLLVDPAADETLKPHGLERCPLVARPV